MPNKPISKKRQLHLTIREMQTEVPLKTRNSEPSCLWRKAKANGEDREPSQCLQEGKDWGKGRDNLGLLEIL